MCPFYYILIMSRAGLPPSATSQFPPHHTPAPWAPRVRLTMPIRVSLGNEGVYPRALHSRTFTLSPKQFVPSISLVKRVPGSHALHNHDHPITGRWGAPDSLTAISCTSQRCNPTQSLPADNFRNSNFTAAAGVTNRAIESSQLRYS